jgi:sugar phosphate isomerase/epimerase
VTRTLELTRRSLFPVVAASGFPLGVCAQARTSWLPGLQLYTVRDLLAADLDGTLRTVAEIGYREVELAGSTGASAQVMQATLKRHGLGLPSLHASYERLRADLEAVLEEARGVGAGFVVCPSIDADQRRTADDWKRACRWLGEIGRVARSHDLLLAYHNHDFEFVPFRNGMTPFQLMITETDPQDVKLEVDVYWVARAGLDPVQCLKDGQPRVLLVHLKDLGADGSTTELGEGVLDTERIIRTALLAGAKHLFVEQDTSADPLRSVATSLRFLERLPADVRPRS